MGCGAASCIAAARFAHGSDFSNYPNPAARPFTRELYETADGRWLQFTMVRSDEETARLLDVLGAAALLADPRYASQELRLANATEIAAKLRPIVAQQDAAHWLTALAEAGVPVSMVGRIDDLASDEQLTANNVLVPPADDIAVDYVINHPVNVDALPRVGVRRAPEPGEHTGEVLAELGYGEDAVADFPRTGDRVGSRVLGVMRCPVGATLVVDRVGRRQWRASHEDGRPQGSPLREHESTSESGLCRDSLKGTGGDKPRPDGLGSGCA